MTGLSNHRERLVDLTVAALAQARLVHRTLSTAIMPALPPQRRLFAEQITRGLSREDFLNESFIRDAAAFVNLLDREIEGGTHIAWVADEHDTRGGGAVRHREPRAQVLAEGRREIAGLCQMIEAVLDTARAESVAEILLQS